MKVKQSTDNMRKSRWHGIKVHTVYPLLWSSTISVVSYETAAESLSKTNPSPPDLRTCADPNYQRIVTATVKIDQATT